MEHVQLLAQIISTQLIIFAIILIIGIFFLLLFILSSFF